MERVCAAAALAVLMAGSVQAQRPDPVKVKDGLVQGLWAK